jgi:hypothetical protein
MREVCDFFNTSSGHAKKYTKTCRSSVSTYNQPNLESTQNQPRFLRLKFWAQVSYHGQPPDAFIQMRKRSSLCLLGSRSIRRQFFFKTAAGFFVCILRTKTRWSRVTATKATTEKLTTTQSTTWTSRLEETEEERTDNS